MSAHHHRVEKGWRYEVINYDSDSYSCPHCGEETTVHWAHHTWTHDADAHDEILKVEEGCEHWNGYGKNAPEWITPEYDGDGETYDDRLGRNCDEAQRTYEAWRLKR